MQVKAQVFSKKGFYGPELNFEVRLIGEISCHLVELFDKMPDELEGEQLTDWTRLHIIIEREPSK